MKTVYSDQQPTFDAPSIFLAGPTPRTAQVVSWRIRALEIVQELALMKFRRTIVPIPTARPTQPDLFAALLDKTSSGHGHSSRQFGHDWFWLAGRSAFEGLEQAISLISQISR